MIRAVITFLLFFFFTLGGCAAEMGNPPVPDEKVETSSSFSLLENDRVQAVWWAPQLTASCEGAIFWTAPEEWEFYILGQCPGGIDTLELSGGDPKMWVFVPITDVIVYEDQRIWSFMEFGGGIFTLELLGQLSETPPPPEEEYWILHGPGILSLLKGEITASNGEKISTDMWRLKNYQ